MGGDGSATGRPDLSVVRGATYPVSPPLLGEPAPVAAQIDAAIAAARPRMNTLAVWSLVFGCLAFLGVISVVLGLVAVGIGLFARRRIEASYGMQRGSRIAVAGVCTGATSAAINTWLIVVLVLSR